jgi:uncharacterized membrane protein YcaP (DUF421 family)
MEFLIEIFGRGKDLSILQMSARAALAFFICLCLIRLSGRRSFGMRMPLDNVIVILLGAVLSRAVVGASPFFATIAACVTICLLHRLCGWLGMNHKFFGLLLKGKSAIIYENGAFHRDNMRKAMITEEDVTESLRTHANLGSLDQVRCIYFERNGQLSIVKKDREHAG